MPKIAEHPVYRQLSPEKRKAAIMLSAPHGGAKLPSLFLKSSPLNRQALLETADLRTDRLVLEQDIFPAIAARFARSFVDLNRSRNCLDPQVVEVKIDQIETHAKAGYGVIPRFAERGKLIHSGKISQAEAEDRLVDFYDPYHQMISKIFAQTKRDFGTALLLDIHSAPQSILGKVDIQFGSRFGATISPMLYDGIVNLFNQAGYKIMRETPFAGGYITAHYADPPNNIETLQIEINRKHLEPSCFAGFQETWLKIIKSIAELYTAIHSYPNCAE